MKPVFQHITVPVDGSATGGRGIAIAVELARDGGRVSFCSVADATLDILGADAALVCNHAQEEAAKHGIACDMQVLHGQSSAEILSFAAHNGSDAIVVGTHFWSGLSRAVLGSIAEGLMRRSAIPIVSVHEDDALRTGSLAVAMDPSPAAQAALDLGIAIAAARGMSLMILYVRDSSPDSAEINAVLDVARDRVRGRGIATHLVVREGDPTDQLLAAAEDHDCCMLVMGSHGQPVSAPFGLGSVAATVIGRAHIPVVTVRCAA